MSWRERAACRGTIKVEVFYDRDPRIALEVCRGCPVILECRADADATETMSDTDGVRGGETAQQRIDRRSPSFARRRPINHGTPGGYVTHRRRGEEACDACKAAHALAYRIRQERLNGHEPLTILHGKAS